MPLMSIWDYLRQRTRDAVLAGFQDALEVAEQNDQASSEYEAATKLRTRLGAAAALGQTGQAALPPVAVAEGPKSSPAEVAVNTILDEVIDARLNGVLDPTAGQPPVSGSELHPYRRKRGRPRKDEVR
jgi:hypothetical protein